MKLTKAILGCTAGAVIATQFEKGDECPDDLLAAALENEALADADIKKAQAIVAKQVEDAAALLPVLGLADDAVAQQDADAA